MTTTLKGIEYGFSRGADWLTPGNDNLYRSALLANEQWGPRAAAFSGLTYAYFGGAAWSGSAWTEVADGTIALTDNATNYVERTEGGTVSKNTTSFTASKIPMAKITTVSGAITAIAERRREQVPTAGGSSGGISGVLEQHTASASASLDFTTWYSSTYDEYLIEIVSLITSTTAQPGFQMSTNAGSSYDGTGGNYEWRAAYAYSGGGGMDGSSTSTRLDWRGATVTLGANGAYNGTFRIYNPASTALYKFMTGQAMFYDTGLWISNWTGVYKSATAVNAFRVIPSTGTLTSGTVRVYGIVK